MDSKVHVLAIPFPLQGHINPMVQLSKLLISKGVKVTFLITETLCSMLSEVQQAGSIGIETTPDVIVEGHEPYEAFIKGYEASISHGLRSIVEKLEESGCPVNFIAFDAYSPWALDIAHDLGLRGIAFSTQPIAVAALYHHVQQGTLSLPLQEGEVISLPSLPNLVETDLPSFTYAPNSYPCVLELVLKQTRSFFEADWLLFNTFDMLEDEILSWAEKQWKIKNVGPLIPTKYLENKQDNDKDYGMSIFKHSDNDTLTQWLDSKDPASVVYVSFGSLSTLEQDQMHEIASGLANSQCNFLWVVRASEESKLPSNFSEEIKDRGMIVNWCSQLGVLAHRAVGGFLTHAGWNSTLEGLSLGVPMVAMPIFVEQTTNAKFIADVWHVGIRAKVEENGFLSKGEVERCVKEVMEGEERVTLLENALKWKKLSNEAINGGSSEKNVEELISELHKLATTPL